MHMVAGLALWVQAWRFDRHVQNAQLSACLAPVRKGLQRLQQALSCVIPMREDAQQVAAACSASALKQTSWLWLFAACRGLPGAHHKAQRAAQEGAGDPRRHHTACMAHEQQPDEPVVCRPARAVCA